MNQTDDGFEDYPSNLDPVDDEEDLAGLINTYNNYSYDALGNLIRDELSEIELIQWTVAGKVASVDQDGSSGKNDLQFSYGAGGQRTMKDVQDDDGQLLWRDHYVRDAQGNVMAHYRYTPGTGSLKVRERPMYGSSRLGVDDYQLELGGMPLSSYDPMQDPAGMLRYELTDHLGNVTTVITDELLGVNTDADAQFEYFQPTIVSAQGYEPFGGLLPGRNHSSDAYRFAFQGHEKDDEFHRSSGTSFDFGARIYDPRVSRFLSIDPRSNDYTWLSPYAFAANSPVKNIDENGEGPIDPRTGKRSYTTILTLEYYKHLEGHAAPSTPVPSYTYDGSLYRSAAVLDFASAGGEARGFGTDNSRNTQASLRDPYMLNFRTPNGTVESNMQRHMWLYDFDAGSTAFMGAAKSGNYAYMDKNVFSDDFSIVKVENGVISSIAEFVETDQRDSKDQMIFRLAKETTFFVEEVFDEDGNISEYKTWATTSTYKEDGSLESRSMTTTTVAAEDWGD